VSKKSRHLKSIKSTIFLKFLPYLSVRTLTPTNTRIKSWVINSVLIFEQIQSLNWVFSFQMVAIVGKRTSTNSYSETHKDNILLQS